MSQQPFITDLLNELKLKYVDLLEDATKFYEEYDALFGLYAREKARIHEIDEQVKTIHSYKEENGVFPQIKDQPDALTYLQELADIKQRTEQNLKQLEPKVFAGFEKRRAKLNKLSSLIVENVVKEKDLTKFLTTIILRAPLAGDHTRCPSNEKAKPLYIAAMAAKFLMQLIEQDLVKESFIVDRYPELVESKEHPGHKELDPETLEVFKKDVLQPVIEAALIHNIGSYSNDAQRIFRGNRYRELDENTRKDLVRIIYENTLNYLTYGLGSPKELSNTEDESQHAVELQKFIFKQTLLANYSKAQHPLGNVIRIPMIYSAFMLSTKLKHDNLLAFRAYGILKSGISKNIIHKDFGEIFKQMVGRYPLGAGLFFISKETHVPERAVVTGLNPPNENCAIVKQLTRRQLQFDDHTQIKVTPQFLIDNEVARTESDFGPEYYKKQFPKGYYWNPAELWERDIDQKRFWRRDNQYKEN